LAELIARTRHDGDEIYLYAVSYGTYWAQRYLQLCPDDIHGVVLDSICAPGECRFGLRFDELFHETGRAIMGLCADDTECARRLNDDPWGFLGALYEKLDDGHCPAAGLQRVSLRQLLGLMLMYVGLRDYIPAVLYRLDRCDERDVEALEALYHFMEVATTVDDEYSSQVLATHIGVSELFEDPPPTVEEATAAVQGHYFSLDVGPEMAALYIDWPRYARDEYFEQFADTRVPSLMLQGELDPQTPPVVAEPLAERWSAEHQTFVRVPWSAHTVLTQSPVDDLFNLTTCGFLLMKQFLNDPETTLDTSCTDRVVGLNFDGWDTDLTQLVLGEAHAWDNAGLVAPHAQRAAQAAERLFWNTRPPPIPRWVSPSPRR
jgi:pimeloyl-ACP methyl ester carboxylesterase